MSQNVPSEKRTLLALALASGTSIENAAEQFGLSRKTIHRYLTRPTFRRKVAELRGQVLATALGRLTDNMTQAADTVAALLKDEQPHIRLRAARALMSFGLRFHESVDVNDRVQELERELDRQQEAAP